MKVGRGIPMLCIRSIVHYINIYSRIVIQLNMYVKIITSSGFKSTILTDFVQGQLRVPFRFGRCLPEVHLFTGSCRLLRRLFDYARGSTQMGKKKNRSRIYDLGVVPTRGNNVQKRTITYMTYMFWKLITVLLKLIFLGDFSILKIFLILEVTNARKLLPHGQNFGLGCSKSGYNPWLIQK